MTGQAPTTEVSLIARIASNSNDPDAWSRFVFLYGPHLVHWCRRYGLQEADACDIAQDVLMTISRQLPRFTYDPSQRFRGWLRSVVHGAWSEWVERQRPWHRFTYDPAVLAAMSDQLAGEELVALVEAEHDRELLDLAMARVGRRVEPRTMAAFRMIALEGLSGKDAAERLGMKLGSTFAAKAKVQRMIREEVERLDRVISC